jgi:hypothetical protein
MIPPFFYPQEEKKMFFRIPHAFIKPASVLISLLLSTALLAGCNLPSAGTPAPLPSPTLAPQPLDTSTQVPPSPTPQPTATATSAPINIVFATGTTAAVEKGSVQAGQVVTYTLDAGQNQPMMLILNSANGDVFLGVTGPDGGKLLDPAVYKWSSWQWVLPKTGVYSIQVIGGAVSETYTLTAKVAELVQFGSGTISASKSGTTVNGYIVSYAFSCQAGQTMTASLNVPASTAYLDIFGIASGPILNATSLAPSWTGTLPSTQEYVVEVIPSGGQVVNYTLTVTVH